MYLIIAIIFLIGLFLRERKRSEHAGQLECMINYYKQKLPNCCKCKASCGLTNMCYNDNNSKQMNIYFLCECCIDKFNEVLKEDECTVCKKYCTEFTNKYKYFRLAKKSKTNYNFHYDIKCCSKCIFFS